jgi:hypothetical protein
VRTTEKRILMMPYRSSARPKALDVVSLHVEVTSAEEATNREQVKDMVNDALKSMVAGYSLAARAELIDAEPKPPAEELARALDLPVDRVEKILHSSETRVWMALAQEVCAAFKVEWKQVKYVLAPLIRELARRM